MRIIYLTLFLPIPYHSYHFLTYTLRAYGKNYKKRFFIFSRHSCVGFSVLSKKW